jgi:WD40 repeat protein/serine/threonine protein kinase
MSADESPLLEEHFTSLLAACDDALAGGNSSMSLSGTEVPPELRPRLEGDLACMQRLQKLRPRHWPWTPATPFGLALSPGWSPGLSRLNPGRQPEEAATTLGRFQIRHELGRGGFGVVFLAYDPRLDRDVALKVPRADALISPELRERFHREARAAAGLDHPNLVAVYEAGEVGPICYIAEAYCPGITLAAWLKGRAGLVPAAEAAALVATLAEAVQHAHDRGVLHRDLKPANVLLDCRLPIADCRLKDKQSGEAPLTIGNRQSAIGNPKITDFGLAKYLGEDFGTGRPAGQTRTGTIVGTPGYMAPEQAGGKSKAIGPAADVYALGAILYELLTSRPPFQAESALETLLQVQSVEPVSPARLRPRLPRDLETICLKCLQKEPRKRYGSAAALAADLRHFLAGEPIQARPVGRVQRLWRWCRRNPALAAASGLAAGALVAVVSLSIGYGIERSNTADQLRTALGDAQVQRRLADQAANDVRRKQRETAAALQEARRQAATVALERALGLCEQGESGRGLLWLARSLEMAPDDAGDLQRVIRLNLAAWSRQLHTSDMHFQHENYVTAAAISRDGRTILTAGYDWNAWLWDAATGRPKGPPLKHPQRKVEAAAFSPDGQRVLTGCHDGAARLWEAKPQRTKDKGQPRRKGNSGVGPYSVVLAFWHSAPVTAVAFSPDGSTILTGSEDKTARLWDAATGKPRGSPLGHRHKVWAVAFSPNGKTVLTGSGDITESSSGEARFWHVDTGRPLSRTLPHRYAVRGVQFSPDGQTILTTSLDKVQLWERATGRPIGQPLPQPAPFGGLAFGPGGRTVLTAGNDRTARLWDVATGKQIGPPLPHQSAVRAVAFRADGQTILTASQDWTARLWKVSRHKPVGSKLQVHGPGFVMAFSADSRIILTGHRDGRFRLCQTTTGEPIGPPLQHGGEAGAAAFSYDGRIVLTGSWDQTAQLWKAATGQRIGPLLRHRGPVLAGAFSADGKTILTGSSGFPKAEAQFWKVGKGKPFGPSLPHAGDILAVAFSPDGRRVLTGCRDQKARLWDVATRKLLGTPLCHQGPVQAVAFSPDGRTVLTGSHDHTARHWEAATGKPLGAPLVHSWQVFGVSFSPDGKILLTGGSEGIGRLWDAATLKPLGPPLVHCADGVMTVGFGANGRTAWTAAWDQTVRRWPVPVAAGGHVKKIVLWAEVLTGMELDQEGTIRVLDAKTWHLRRRQLGPGPGG